MKEKAEKRTDQTNPIIHVLECKACGRCIAACPQNALAMGHEFNARGYRYAKYVSNDCIGCRNCFYTCPEPGAIEIRHRSRKQD